MLKFFRKIRRKLLDGGKLKRYLIYAAGETFLVMIGILLALQVNNWNTQRLEASKNGKLLHKMSNEIQSNIDRAKDLIEKKEVSISYSTRLEKILVTGKPLDSLDVFFSGFQFPFQVIHPGFNSSAYQEAQNTGALYSLGSDSLLFKIEKYFLLCDRESYIMLKRAENIAELLENSPLAKTRTEYSFIKRYNLPKASFLSQNKWLGDKTHPDYKKLTYVMVRSRAASRASQNFCNRIIKESEKLMAAIKEELKN